MTGFLEIWLMRAVVDRFKNHMHDFLDDFISHAWHPQSTLPHHPHYGQQVEIIRVRRGPDPDLIIRHIDGYHGAIAASWTTYASAPDALPAEKPPVLDLEGRCQLARVVEQLRERNHVPEEHRL